MEIEKFLPEIQKNISLAEYTTFKIGGPADYFFQAKTKQDLIKTIKVAVLLKLPFFILGGGSNVLAADEGYRGLVIKIKNQKLKVKNYESRIEINCDAGLMLKDLVAKTAELSLAGLEWAAGIPGTIGGAIRGNAGAFGKSTGESIKEVEELEFSKNKTEIKKLSKDECNFGYRNSIFKQRRNLIVLSACLQFKKGDKKEIEKKIKENLDYRKKNHPLIFPSAGSIFKNPSEVSAAELIEKCGLKGRKIGQAQISEKHCNFIVNLGGAKAQDVKNLIDLIKSEIKKKFGTELEKEVEFINT